MEEKRSSARVQKNLIIQFSFDAEGPSRKWDVSSIRDIGEKGVSFNAASKVPVGSIIHMLIKIPLRPFEWFEISGKLISVEEPKVTSAQEDLQTFLMRVTFLDLQDEQKTLIHDYISWCISKSGGAK
jgi:hypothetical protein